MIRQSSGLIIPSDPVSMDVQSRTAGTLREVEGREKSGLCKSGSDGSPYLIVDLCLIFATALQPFEQNGFPLGPTCMK